MRKYGYCAYATLAVLQQVQVQIALTHGACNAVQRCAARVLQLLLLLLLLALGNWRDLVQDHCEHCVIRC